MNNKIEGDVMEINKILINNIESEILDMRKAKLLSSILDTSNINLENYYHIYIKSEKINSYRDSYINKINNNKNTILNYNIILNNGLRKTIIDIERKYELTLNETYNALLIVLYSLKRYIIRHVIISDSLILKEKDKNKKYILNNINKNSYKISSDKPETILEEMQLLLFLEFVQSKYIFLDKYFY